jgi:hypothetical protein
MLVVSAAEWYALLVLLDAMELPIMLVWLLNSRRLRPLPWRRELLAVLVLLAD